jgi:hypothetical protein
MPQNPIRYREAFAGCEKGFVSEESRGALADGVPWPADHGIDVAHAAERAALGLNQQTKPPRDRMDVSCAGKTCYVGAAKRWAGIG